MLGMVLLVIAALLWFGIHVGISGTRLRNRLVQWMGEQRFRGFFSLLSIVTLLLLIGAWTFMWTTPLWFAPMWLRWILVFVMLLAFVLFVASLTQPNQTMIGAPGGLPRGVHRVTRHPMLWSFVLWATVHIIGAGDSGALVFFGSFLVTAIVGMPSIDAKLARRDPARWQALSAVTSIVPFVAIMQGRNHFVLREIGVLPPLIGVVVWGVVLHFHVWLFGYAPVAM